MHEGLQLFEEVVQNPIFHNTPMFVFLNKKDLFEQMMRGDGVPLTRCFPDYRVSLANQYRTTGCVSRLLLSREAYHARQLSAYVCFALKQM